MKDEAEDEAGCRAREILSCHCTVKAGDYHTVDCPANYREDIAAALREAQEKGRRDFVIESNSKCEAAYEQGQEDGYSKGWAAGNEHEDALDAEIVKLKAQITGLHEDAVYFRKRCEELENLMECGHYGANLQPDDANVDICMVCAEVAKLKAEIDEAKAGKK